MALAKFLDYVDAVETAAMSNNELDRDEFRRLLEPVIGLLGTDHKMLIEDVFKILDENRDGVIDINELTQFEPFKQR